MILELFSTARQGIPFQDHDYKTKIMYFANRVTAALITAMKTILHHVKHPQQQPEK